MSTLSVESACSTQRPARTAFVPASTMPFGMRSTSTPETVPSSADGAMYATTKRLLGYEPLDSWPQGIEVVLEQA